MAHNVVFTGTLCSLAVLGYKKPLEKNDVWQLNDEDSSQHLNKEFEKFWQKQMKSASKYVIVFLLESSLI